MSSMASNTSTHIPPGQIAHVISQVYNELSEAVEGGVWTNKKISDMVNALNKWERTIEWIEEDNAKKNGFGYFFFTLNRVLYNFFSLTFSNPSSHLRMPAFAEDLKQIIKVLNEINKHFGEILTIAADGRQNEDKIKQVEAFWDKIYGAGDEKSESEKKVYGLVGQLKELMEPYQDKVSRRDDIELVPPVLQDPGSFPFVNSSEALNQQIQLIDEMNGVYWEWAKKIQNAEYLKGSDESAKALFSGTDRPKIYLDKVNNFFLFGAAYHSDFIIVGQGGEKGSATPTQFAMLTDVVRNDIVLIPQQVLGEGFHQLEPQMKLAIRKILQISELSIRSGPFKNTGAYVELSKGARLIPKRERNNKAAIEDIKEIFKINLNRFFNDVTKDEKGQDVPYPGATGTRGTGRGQQVWANRLKHLHQSHGTIELFKGVKDMRSFGDAQRLVTAAVNNSQLKKSGDGSGSRGRQATSSTRTGDRSRSPVAGHGGRKTRRRKKKTKRRKKTRRRKRTKKKRKKKKKKRRKTKRRRRK